MRLSSCLHLAMLAIASVIVSCDSGTGARDSQLANGWVTGCTGPEFNRIPRGISSASSAEKPVFKISDQLVLAVPKTNWPSANRIDHAPRECRTIRDLPTSHYLYFVIRGSWSAGYKPEDIPVVGGSKQFQPDAVTVRIEKEVPSRLSAEERRKVEQIQRKWQQDYSKGTQEIDGLTCLIPVVGVEWTNCFSSRKNSGSGVARLRYRRGYGTSFVLIQADYAAPRYGGVHVYWQTWTSDITHAMSIDNEIWESLGAWNIESAARAD